MNFEGKVVIVTGASRGIGKEIAMSFGRAGGNVACLATTVAGAQATADSIVAEGGKAKGFACDISDSASVDSAIESINSELGAPAVLVNNAGMTRDTLMLRMKDEDWDSVIDVNLKGAFLMIRGVSKLMMKARYGRIVNLTSIIGLGGGAGQANYAAAKAGLVGLTKSVAKEFGTRNITCNAIAPGFIETDMTHDLPEDMREQVKKMAPAGRLGTPADIAPAVMFLASDGAGYITGQVLVIDGGLTL